MPRGSASRERIGERSGSAFANGQQVSGHRVISVRYQGDEKRTVLESPQATTPVQREQVAQGDTRFLHVSECQPSYFTGPTAPNRVELA
jgi:hypothetical protein